LGQYVDAVGVLVDHPVDPADLALDASHALQVGLLVRGVPVRGMVLTGRSVLRCGRGGALGGHDSSWAGRSVLALHGKYTPSGYGCGGSVRRGQRNGHDSPSGDINTVSSRDRGRGLT